jgi:hypothetical protein
VTFASINVNKDNNDMYMYKNVSGNSLTIIAQGHLSTHNLAPGDTVTSDVPLENPNLEYQGEAQTSDSAGIVGTQQRQPGAITDAQQIENTKGDE